jgi:hypothetical protein
MMGAFRMPIDRTLVLTQAADLINNDRDRDYGSADANHLRIATIWGVILGTPVTPAQVALCMAGTKIARLAHDITKVDSWVDMAGYAALGAEMATDKEYA